MGKIDIPVCLKVGQEKWIKALKDGTACFNHVGFFIDKAIQTGNNEEGDFYEGVLARLKKSNPLLVQTIERFGEDIELNDDGEYVILRRKSVRNIPAFCIYGVRGDELTVIEESIYFDEASGQHKGKVRYDFPSKLYHGFLDTPEGDAVWSFLCSTGHFFEGIETALQQQGYTCSKCVEKYDIDLSKEFYIDPEADGPYSELTHKRIDLEYQHEVRLFLPENPTDDKILIPYKPLSSHSAGIASSEGYIEMTVTLGEKEQ